METAERLVWGVCCHGDGRQRCLIRGPECGVLLDQFLADPGQVASLPGCEFLHLQDGAKEDAGLIEWL